jgi:glyoxylase-like metal-dependent hydrolase (beta-lactamase superfamily II)
MSGPELIAVPVLSIEAVPAPALLHLSDYGRELPILGYAWLYRPDRDARWILIDTGTEDVEPANVGRPPSRCWRARSLLPSLVCRGILAEEIADVIVTHLHHDHCGAIGLLGGARWHVPAVEWAFVNDPVNADLTPEPLFPRSVFRQMADHGVMTMADGDEPVAGLRMRHLGGHTVGAMAVEVLDPRGAVRVVLGGDVMPLYENLSRAIPPGTLWHWGECRRALERLAAYDVPVLPSHDPELMQKFPEGVVLDG